MYYYPPWNGYGWNYPGGYQNGSGSTPNTSTVDVITNGAGQPSSGGTPEEGADPTIIPT